MSNSKLGKVMLITTIIGIITTIMFAMFFDENIEILLFPAFFYILAFFIIGYGFRWKFGKDTGWIGMLCLSPFTIELFGFLIIECLFSWDIAICFIQWFSMIGVTISVLIFEYKFSTHNKKSSSINRK